MLYKISKGSSLPDRHSLREHGDLAGRRQQLGPSCHILVFFVLCVPGYHSLAVLKGIPADRLSGGRSAMEEEAPFSSPKAKDLPPFSESHKSPAQGSSGLAICKVGHLSICISFTNVSMTISYEVMSLALFW